MTSQAFEWRDPYLGALGRLVQSGNIDDPPARCQELRDVGVHGGTGSSDASTQGEA